MSRAYIKHVDYNHLKSNLSDGLDFINWKNIIKRDSKVFIKPNFTFPFYQKGVTTTPKLLEAILEIIRERTSTVTVGESDGGNHSFLAEQSFHGHDMYHICKKLGINLVNLSKMPSKFIRSRIQNKRITVQLPNLLLEDVDCFISVPVLKVHVMTGVSLGLKNLWGCNPNTMRCLSHQNLGHQLALMAKLIDPKLTIIDGIYGLDGHGPMFGYPKKMNLLMMSDNILTADVLGSTVMGVSPKQVNHFVIAEKEKIGFQDLDKVKINTNFNPYVKDFHVKKTLLDYVSSLFFNNNLATKVVMKSPFTPIFYKFGGMFRSADEKDTVNTLNRFH